MFKESKEYFQGLGLRKPNHYRILHGIRVAIGCSLGVLIARFFNLPSGQWVPITVMVVMSAQTHFGGAVRKAYMRLLGTVSGIGIAVAVLFCCGTNFAVMLGVVLVSCTIFAYIAASHDEINYAGTLGGVTLLLTLTSPQASVELALQRGINILIGIVVAILTAWLVFPVHARDRFRVHLITTLWNLRTIYQAAISGASEDPVATKLAEVVADDIALAQPRLLREATIGSRFFAAHKVLFAEIINSEHQVNRVVNLLIGSVREAKLKLSAKDHLAALQTYHQGILTLFTELAQTFECLTFAEDGKVPRPPELDLQLVEKIIKNSDLELVITECSLIFLLEQLVKELTKLRQLVEKVHGKTLSSMI